MFIFKAVFLLNFFYISSATVILKPVSDKGLEAGIVLFQGDNITAKNYMNFAQELQNKLSNVKLWIAISEFQSSSPDKFKAEDEMKDIFNDFIEAGFYIESDTPFYFIGHSIGGAVLQDYLINNIDELPVKMNGLILEGSYIQRKNYESIGTLPSILTIGAELDGLVRITRIAESYYLKSKFSVPNLTLVIKGMNHYQFSGDNNPPPENIKINDFSPEISNANATSDLTDIISAYMSLSLNLAEARQDNINKLAKYSDSTKELLNPIIEAFNLEGSYNYNLPCYQSNLPNCTYGSAWTQTSQQIMGTKNVSMLSKDQFFPAAQIFPDPLPIIYNSCQKPYDCTLNISTVSEAIYSSDRLKDIPSSPQGAKEIRSKLNSRQKVLLAATGIKEDFNVVDAGNLCSEINQESLNWALNRTPNHILKRYNDKGNMLRIGPDRDMSSYGPLWIWTSISYTNKLDNKDQREYTEVVAPVMKFSVDYWISLSAGFHFCKVLSPARAIEWIYFDSLKGF